MAKIYQYIDSEQKRIYSLRDFSQHIDEFFVLWLATFEKVFFKKYHIKFWVHNNLFVPNIFISNKLHSANKVWGVSKCLHERLLTEMNAFLDMGWNFR